MRQPQLPMINFLNTQGASMLNTSDGGTMLHVATGAIHPSGDDGEDDCNEDDALEVVRFLVKCGCDPAAPNDYGDTPLYIALDYGRIKLIKYLLPLNNPLPPDILSNAIRNSNDFGTGNCLDIVRALVTSGCDPQTPDSEGDTPLQVAIVAEAPEVVEYLLSVVPVCKSSPEDPLSATALASPDVQRRMPYDRFARSESPDLPPAKRTRRS